jgi:hypothetical protein
MWPRLPSGGGGGMVGVWDSGKSTSRGEGGSHNRKLDPREWGEEEERIEGGTQR